MRIAQAQADARESIFKRIRALSAHKESGVLLALIAFFTTMWIITPVFRQPYNIGIILKQISVTAIAAMGQTLAIISGAFDLSQGSIAGLAAMVSALAYQQLGLPPLLAISVGLGVGIMCGFVNGALAARFRLHPIVMTLATGSIFVSLNYYITRGHPVTGLPKSFLWLGQGDIGPLPVPVLLMFVVSIMMHFMLTRTLFGLRVLQIGGNAESAHAVGIRVERVQIGVFIISGFLSALAGIVTVGRVGNALATIGQDMLFPVVTASIIGGTLLSGGVGSMAGTLMGAGIMGIVRNGLVILRFNPFLQDAAQGLLVLAALLIDQFRRGKLTWAKIIGKERQPSGARERR